MCKDGCFFLVNGLYQVSYLPYIFSYNCSSLFLYDLFIGSFWYYSLLILTAWTELHIREIGTPEDSNEVDEGYLKVKGNKHEVDEGYEGPDLPAVTNRWPKLLSNFIHSFINCLAFHQCEYRVEKGIANYSQDGLRESYLFQDRFKRAVKSNSWKNMSVNKVTDRSTYDKVICKNVQMTSSIERLSLTLITPQVFYSIRLGFHGQFTFFDCLREDVSYSREDCRCNHLCNQWFLFKVDLVPTEQTYHI